MPGARLATPRDVSPLAGVLARAFADDPIYLWTFGRGNSIWSPSVENSTSTYSRNSLNLANGRSYISPPSQPSTAPLPLTHNSLAPSQSWQPLPPNSSGLPNHLNGSLSDPFVQQQTFAASHQRMLSDPLSSLRSSLAPPQLYESLNANIYSTGAINEPLDVSHAGFVGRPAANGLTNAGPTLPAASNYYRQPQPDMFAVNQSANHLRREQVYHSPFQASSISNIWGSPG